jgi:TonB family protein
VIGVLRPEIVVPRWLRDRPAPDRGLVLAHERAHVEARDPLLVCAAWVAAACVPWNPAVWLQVARLRSRMEEDCDRRVLRDRPWSEARRYGELVIDLGTRTPRTPRWAAAAAFAAGRPPLERRIRSMYDLYPPLSRIRRFLAVAGVLGLAGALVALPRPAGFGARSGELADEAVPPTPSEVPDARPVAVEPPSIEVPPPVEAPPSVGEDITERPTFTPYTVAPDLVNRTQVQAALQAAYPPLLRDAGIGGTARVWFFIDAEGTVQDTRIDQSSGHAAIDDAALEVASEMRFSPALNRDQPVPVWVAFPITFQVR